MTKKQEEEDVKKQRYESEMEDSLHAISDYSEKKREIEMEIDSQEKVLRQPIATIGIEVIKNKSAEMDSLLRIACAESKVVYRCLEAEVEAVSALLLRYASARLKVNVTTMSWSPPLCDDGVLVR
jgi:hypothetical protein